MTRHHNHHDDDEDNPHLVRDGEGIRVRMALMDGLDTVQRAIARDGLHDGRGNHDAVGHRQGHIVDASDVDGDERRRRMYAQYDAEKAAEYLGDASPPRKVSQGLEDDEQRDGTMTLDRIEAQHRATMQDEYAAYDARVRNMWRVP
jgi:hypothetical protein